MVNLVSYSDSEGSDDDESQPSKEEAPKPSVATKQSFQKVVDRSNPSKIRVNLPTAKATGAQEDQTAKDDERPAKRARTDGGGGGLFGGLSSFLPAPKRSGNAAPSAVPDVVANAKSGGNRPLGRGLGKGVNLRTGSAPAFSRERPVFEPSSEETGRTYVPVTQKDTPAAGAASEPQIKLVGKVTRFMPLSVARNAKKKKEGKSTASRTAAVTSKDKDATEVSLPKPITPPKPKVSLFSIGKPEEPISIPADELEDTEEPDDDFLGDTDKDNASVPPEVYDQASYEQSSFQAGGGSHTLDSIATDLSLDEASRRQLFGRRNKGSDIPINLVNFNTDAEYAANEAIRASGETAQHNPVRAIQPGKHNLKQLVNAATSQRDALEESWAAGKRKKNDAGNRYGW
jgi:hypothetical protein